MTSRVKGRESFAEKLNRKGGKYEKLGDVTDLVGIRIITYLTGDVDRIADLIEAEFVVDRANSVDKRLYEDPDRFGYKSLHYVVELPPPRTTLAEYRPFEGIKAEIQVRTIIQHAWAEIEHDLGYKSTIGVPTEIRRRFFRLSALLETADDEFAAISSEIANYRMKVRAEMAAGERSQEIDATTVQEFVRADPQFLEVSGEIARRTEMQHGRFGLSGHCEHAAEYLRWCGLQTLNEVDTELRSRRAEIVEIATKRLNDHGGDSFSCDLVLLYLAYSILVDRQDPDVFVRFLADNHYGDPDTGGEIYEQINESRENKA
ncbi:MAG: hypothetical protein V4584_07320 [Verrucomicrobiota bacterium]